MFGRLESIDFAHRWNHFAFRHEVCRKMDRYLEREPTRVLLEERGIATQLSELFRSKIW
jgi:hypothetical protein